MSQDKSPLWLSLQRVLVLLPTLALTLSLGITLLSLPPAPVQMLDTILDKMPHSGVINPVTAVLLNFRGYDTLLEIGVLLVAVFGMGTLPDSYHKGSLSIPSPGPILLALVRLLVPLMVLVAGYFLWVGAHAPGGAFQAGAILGAAAVLVLLVGLPLSVWFHGWWFRAVLMMGFALFLGVGIWTMGIGGHFLEYPRDRAGDLILLIEASASVSIGLILARLFLGSSDPADATNMTKEHP
jgi:multisubunit Na+/H+ antiporter MnhB subunit